MDWSNVFCAGGAVLACVVPPQGGVFQGSDIDLWIYGIKDDDAANEKVKHVHSVITRNCSSRGQVVRTNRAITILGEYPYRHVQIILRCALNAVLAHNAFELSHTRTGISLTFVGCTLAR